MICMRFEEKDIFVVSICVDTETYIDVTLFLCIEPYASNRVLFVGVFYDLYARRIKNHSFVSICFDVDMSSA